MQCLINTKQSVACPTKVEECVLGKDKNPDIWVIPLVTAALAGLCESQVYLNCSHIMVVAPPLWYIQVPFQPINTPVF